MATYSKVLPSGSTQGEPIKVGATGTPGTLFHTTGVSATIIDEVWLYAFNSDTVDRTLTIEFGDATAPDHNIVITVPFKSGLVLVVPGLLLTGSGTVGATVKAFASSTNVVTVAGHINRIS